MSPGTPRVAIDIRWLAVANKSPKGGWRPVVEVNGVKFGDVFGSALSADEALAEAKAMAEEERGKWRGDYDVTVGPAQAPRGASR